VRLPFAAGAVVSLLALVLFVGQIPPATCRDGWQSPSIGSRGACSHHGGVERHGGLYLLSVLGSGALGVTVYAFLGRVLRRRAERRFVAQLAVPQVGAMPIDWVIYALRTKRDLVFTYKGREDFEPRPRRVRPVSLELRHERGKKPKEPAFRGLCRDAGEERTFVYGRMREIALAPEAGVEASPRDT